MDRLSKGLWVRIGIGDEAVECMLELLTTQTFNKNPCGAVWINRPIKYLSTWLAFTTKLTAENTILY